MKTSRRDFIRSSALAAAGLYTAHSANATALEDVQSSNVEKLSFKGENKISVFSKNLQWLDYDGMAAVAKEIGFDGVDLTVRPNGHVLPERVKEDLPKAVSAVRKAGLEVYMITTAINDTTEPHTEQILKTANELGIGYYRTNWFPYDDKVSLTDNLTNMKQRLQCLAEMNKKYAIQATYQNHAGTSFGSSVWDLWQVLKDIDTQNLGCQYDVRHATVEGANSWVNGFKLIHPYIKTYVIKDFHWTEKDGKWNEENVPLGKGMVDFKKYFELIKQHQIKCPISVHFEYSLGGAERAAKTISIPKEQVMQAMRQDLATLKRWLDL